MSLSEQEQRLLQEIEQSLLADDPDFGASEHTHAHSESQPFYFDPRGIAIILIGILVVVAGIALSQISLWFVALSPVGFAMMFISGLWMLRRNTPASTGPQLNIDRIAHAKQKGSAGLSAKMEENFRKRFE